MGLEQRHRRRPRSGALGVEVKRPASNRRQWDMRLACLLFLTLFCTSWSHAANFRVQPVDSLQKLTATQPGVLEPFTSKPAQLQAVRGEWECFQVVVTAGDTPLKNLRLQTTPLATHLGDFIPARHVQLYRQNYVYVEQPSGNRRQEKLWWPDALIPQNRQSSITIEAGKAETFWVAVYAPLHAAPGEYFGEIDITADDQTPRRLFVSLQVDKAQMPNPTLRATTAVYYDLLRDWYAKNLDRPFDEKLKRQYYDFLLDYRINAYDLPVPWDSPQAAAYLRDDRVLSVRLPPLSQPENLQSALEALRVNNALQKNFYYHIDEPAPQRYDEVRKTWQKLQAIDPAIKQCVTLHPNQELEGAVDIWCPNIGDFFGLGHLHKEMLAAQRKQGRETWWYTMVEPKYPYPTWLLDDDAQAVRSYGGLMARYGITGFVYSMAHGWGPKPLENLQSFAGTNGDGTLLYPAELVGGSGPMPSIRLMLLRDAIEDYELMHAGLRPMPRLPNGLLREKIKPANLTVPAAPHVYNGNWYRLSHDKTHLTASFHIDTPTLEKEWCAVELAPASLDERFRFVITARGNGVLERHTREGHFRVEGLEWEFSARPTQTGYEAEMKIPLEVVGGAKNFRLNVLRRIGGSSAPVLRAFPDAGDVTLMPHVRLQ